VRLKQAALIVLGLYVCFTATIAHRHTAVVGGLDVPWGLILALVGAYSIARLVDPWVRLGAAFFGLGWAVGLTVPMFSPGGSYLVAQDWLGLTFLLGSLGVLALAIVRGDPHPRL
jgi:hypothetical protein